MPDTAAATDLPAISNVAAGYIHRDKRITPAALVALPGTRLKWYDIALPDAPVPAGIQALARAFVLREDQAGALKVSGELGFAILHRCGGDFYFLIVSTWRNENELWETVYAKDGQQQPDFRPFPLPGPHRGTYCVWELGAVWHEQQAWRRYLLSGRDDAARRAYLGDSHEGPV
jgi:hypothetical protein